MSDPCPPQATVTLKTSDGGLTRNVTCVTHTMRQVARPPGHVTRALEAGDTWTCVTCPDTWLHWLHPHNWLDTSWPAARCNIPSLRRDLTVSDYCQGHHQHSPDSHPHCVSLRDNQDAQMSQSGDKCFLLFLSKYSIFQNKKRSKISKYTLERLQKTSDQTGKPSTKTSYFVT